LSDEWAAAVVADADIRPGDLVVDVGAGTGALTKHLVEADARVVAIELHPLRAERLRSRFAGSAVTVVRADAASLRWPRRPFRVVANPPYAITGELLRSLLVPGSRLERADLVLQRAVVRRYAEGRGPGTARWLRDFEVWGGRPLPRTAFQPPPRVDSSVLVVRRRRARAQPKSTSASA
jgi:23S rRNA (adenine-N6)-dimethyltransferase